MLKRTIYTLLFFIYCFFMLWLASKPAHAQSFFKGNHLVETPTTQATAGGTTALTISSNTVQRFTGTQNQTVTLPDATTLAIGTYYLIAMDGSTGTLTVRDAASGLLGTILPSNSASFRLITKATAAGVWSVENNYTAIPATGISGIVPLANGGTALANVASQGGIAYGTSTGISLNAAGSAGQYLRSNGTSAPTWSAVSVSGEITGILPLANGGTNAANVASHGGIAYSTASAISIGPVGTSGQLLTSNGAASPAWTTNTYPSTATAPCSLLANTNNTITCLAATVANRLMKTNGTTISFSQADLTTDVTGVLPLANGGTNNATVASQGGVAYGTAIGISISTAGTSGQYLKSTGTGVPNFAAITLSGDVSGILPLANGGTNNANVAVNGGAAYGTASGISLTAVGVSGTVLTSTGAGIPLWYKPATVIGTCKWTGSASCQYTTGNTGGAYTDFGADTDCNNPAVTGSASAPGTKIPYCTFSSLPEGQYVVMFNGLLGPENSSVTASQQYRISDGSTTSGQCQSAANATSATTYECDSLNGYFSYTTAQSNISFRPVGASSSDSNDPQLVVNNATTRQMEIIVIYYPR